MQYISYYYKSRGFTFVELLVSVSLVVLMFGGLFVAIQVMVRTIGNTKAESGALALASERLEYLRSLLYDNVGTVGGIPEGLIPQNSTTTLNGIVYQERVLVQYVDAEEDGIGGFDTNGILADYKLAKVEYSWDDRGEIKKISLITNIIPKGIETTTGGGTIAVNVFDATVQPVLGASVHLLNDTTTSTIDITRFTNVDGVALFSGAPAAANYQITVTDTNWSTDQTYSATGTNSNPITPHVAVLQSEVSTMNFQIDELSDLTVKTIGPGSVGSFSDSFVNALNIASTTNIGVSGGSLILAGGPGSYVSAGTALSTSTTPSPISNWNIASFTASSSASTTVRVSVYEVTSTSTYALVSDGVLSGNSSGFTNSPINISGLSVGTYPTLALGVALTTIDPLITPEILDWGITHIVSEPSIGSIDFTLTSNKTIGTTASATPVYKYLESHTTDGSGEIDIVDLEWDVYEVTLDGGVYDISEACMPIPYSLLPNVTDTLKLTLVPSSLRSLRVRVEDVSGSAVAGAVVDLTRFGYSDSGETSTCGQTFFNNALADETDYQIDITASGYISETVTDIAIQNNETLVVVLSAF